MRTGFGVFFRLVWRTYFPGKDSPGRLTPQRFVVMTVFMPLFFLLQVMHWAGFLLDEILFIDYRKIDIKQPLFIVGVPRSGTTFLHRLVAKDKDRFTTTLLWELIFAPSITERKIWLGLHAADAAIGRPFTRLVEFLERKALGQLDDIHGTSLKDPEEDYFALIPMMACFLLTLPWPFYDELWVFSRFDTDLPEYDREKVMRYYKRFIQRHLYVRGKDKQYLSKNPSFTSMVVSLRETFPDCRIIGCVRTPYQTVPSLLNSMGEGTKIFDVDVQGHTYRDHIVDMLKFYYRHLVDRLPEMPGNRHAFSVMEELTAHPKGMVCDFYERFGWHVDEAFAASLQADEDRAKGYKSKHQYSLEQFGLSPGELQRDLDFVFERFNLDREMGS